MHGLNPKFQRMPSILRWPLALYFLFIGIATAETVIIHHPSIPEQAISKDSLVRIYAMKQLRWPDGTPVAVFVLPKNNAAHKSFVTTRLGMQPHHLDRIWYRLVYSGVGRAPTEVSSQVEMLEMVRSTPGAVGYVDSAFIEANGNMNIDVEVSSGE